MSHLEQFRKSRIYLAGLYAKKATELADAVKSNPIGDHHGAYMACSATWNALVDIENCVRAEIIAGDVIDDYHRQPSGEDGSDD